MIVFCKQKTAYDMRISDWSSDVCSSDLAAVRTGRRSRLRRPLADDLAGLGRHDRLARLRQSDDLDDRQLARGDRLAQVGAGLALVRRFHAGDHGAIGVGELENGTHADCFLRWRRPTLCAGWG